VCDIIETRYAELKNIQALIVPQLKTLKERVAYKMILYILYQRVDEIVFEKISGATTFKEA
jgi:hypothetical protein